MEKIRVDILIKGDLINKKCERCYENIEQHSNHPFMTQVKYCHIALFCRINRKVKHFTDFVHNRKL